MADNDDRQLRDLLKVEQAERGGEDRVAKSVAQVRAGVGARDTLVFSIVHIWTVLARILAPLFALFAVRKAEVDAGRRPADDRESKSD